LKINSSEQKKVNAVHVQHKSSFASAHQVIAPDTFFLLRKSQCDLISCLEQKKIIIFNEKSALA
jgi:hypothetical protein